MCFLVRGTAEEEQNIIPNRNGNQEAQWHEGLTMLLMNYLWKRKISFATIACKIGINETVRQSIEG